MSSDRFRLCPRLLPGFALELSLASMDALLAAWRLGSEAARIIGEISAPTSERSAAAADSLKAPTDRLRGVAGSFRSTGPNAAAALLQPPFPA